MQRALAIGNQPRRQPADLAQAAPQPEEDVGRLLREDERPRPEARVAERADDDEALARLAVADRDLAPGLPEVELEQLPRAVDRPLVGARPQVVGAHRAHVVVDDRLVAGKALLRQQLADPLALDPRIVVEQPVELVLEPVELRSPRGTRVGGRSLRAQRPPDRLPVQTRPPPDLPDRQPVDEPHPADLRPQLHADHLLPPGSA
jgi:hypothetical protein